MCERPYKVKLSCRWPMLTIVSPAHSRRGLKDSDLSRDALHPVCIL